MGFYSPKSARPDQRAFLRPARTGAYVLRRYASSSLTMRHRNSATPLQIAAHFQTAAESSDQRAFLRPARTGAYVLRRYASSSLTMRHRNSATPLQIAAHFQTAAESSAARRLRSPALRMRD